MALDIRKEANVGFLFEDLDSHDDVADDVGELDLHSLEVALKNLSSAH